MPSFIAVAQLLLSQPIHISAHLRTLLAPNVMQFPAISFSETTCFYPGGGGYFHMYAYWVCAARERPPFSALNFRSGAYHFHKNLITKKIRTGASPFYIFGRILPFRRPSFSNFLLFQPVHCLPRPAQPERKAFGSAAG